MLVSVQLLVACGGGEGVKRGQVTLTQNGKTVKQMYAITQTGEKVTLYNDGTWQFENKNYNNRELDTDGDLSREDQVKSAVVFELTDKAYKGPFDSEFDSPESLHSYNIYEFKIKNPTSHKIKGLKGIITITDAFDEKMSSFKFSVVEDILPNHAIEWKVKREIQGRDAEYKLQSKEAKDLKAKVKIKKVLFE
jgi:major membrane immunogen (membrane-anchored lipoprotein)